MDKEFGLRFMLSAYLGLGSNVVEPYAREERKSIGAERLVSYQSFGQSAHRDCRSFNSLGDKDKILEKLEEVAEELEEDMQKTGWAGRTVTLKYKLSTYEGTTSHKGFYTSPLIFLVFTRAKSFDRWITKKADLYNVSCIVSMSHAIQPTTLLFRQGRIF